MREGKRFVNNVRAIAILVMNSVSKVVNASVQDNDNGVYSMCCLDRDGVIEREEWMGKEGNREGGEKEGRWGGRKGREMGREKSRGTDGGGRRETEREIPG